ncbi:hypothetical protein Ahy_B06g083857 [Arachis hypogaea]|uniref:Uncharacterized protein n=1 Tax=Arachis hypogaea TaxID=3818 RepID=A0A444YQP2_ARAHY|nr:hypothetical protein Ahy_B06g083857 [Arachis hypogaea]
MFKEKEETSRACATNDIPLPFHVGNSNEDEDANQYILNGISLSNLAAHDEKKVARSFTSSFPYFVRIMKSFNVSGSYTLWWVATFPITHIKLFLILISGGNNAEYPVSVFGGTSPKLQDKDYPL